VGFEPQDAGWESRVRTAFAAQTMMETLGVTIVALEPGRVELRVPFDERLLQQDGSSTPASRWRRWTRPAASRPTR
jgi:acyl-coenzyme A thioesterase PaaI-like protein